MKLKIAIIGLFVLISSCQLTSRPNNIEHDAESVVLVMGHTDTVDYKGTAFSIKSDKSGTYLLTNRHICKPDAELEIETIDHQVSTATIIRVGVDDVCLIHTDLIIHPLKLAKSDAAFGEKAISIGYGLGIGPQVKEGYIEACTKITIEDHTSNAQMVSIPTLPGNSGSAVINQSGEVIGIIFAGSGSSESIAFMIPITSILDFLYPKRTVID